LEAFGPRLALIADTHGLLRPEALAALRGCDVVLHAGDVGRPEILAELQKLAPVVAVRGNVDQFALPESVVVEAAGVRIYMLHRIQDLDLDPAAAGFPIVVSGHSHMPGSTENNGVLYINPGSAGPRRFKLPITVARLDLEVRPWKVEFVELA